MVDIHGRSGHTGEVCYIFDLRYAMSSAEEVCKQEIYAKEMTSFSRLPRIEIDFLTIMEPRLITLVLFPNNKLIFLDFHE
jgi:hypothetical protein